MARYHMESPEWVGVAIRWPDGRIEALELRDIISIELIRETDPYARIEAGMRSIRLNLEAFSATRWHQGADAAPPPSQPRPAIEPAQKAIEA